MPEILLGGYFILLGLTFGCTLLRYRLLSDADKWICWLVALTIITEICASICSLTLHNDMIVFHVYSPLELLMICGYFNASVRTLQSKNKGLRLAAAGFPLALLNTLFLQPYNRLNSIFLLFEGLVICCLALSAYYDLFVHENAEVSRSVHFWITTLVLIYWVFSTVHWGMYFLLCHNSCNKSPLLLLLSGFNYFFYIGLLLIFILYRKMIPSGVR